MPENKELSDRHESEVSDWLPGARRTISSGNKYEKADVQTDLDGSYFCPLVECKSTQQLGFRVTYRLWRQIEEQVYSRSEQMRPVLAVRLYEKSTDTMPVDRVKVKADLAIMDLHDFVELLEENKRMRRRLQERGSN